MDAQRFLQEFGHLANARTGIERLRELVYQLAVTGSLVPQVEGEGSAETILKTVAAVRRDLVASKSWKRSARFESAPMRHPDRRLPPGWAWTRLADLGEINPRNIVADDSIATFVPMAAVSEKYHRMVGGEGVLWSGIKKGYTHIADGDVLLAKITPCFENGKSAVVSGLEGGVGAGSTEFHVFRSMSEEVAPMYIYLFLRSPLFRAKGILSMTGTAGQKRLPTDYFALCSLPLPPFKEQLRIVASANELMALCDKLEAQYAAREKLRGASLSSTLSAIANAQTGFELQVGWERFELNFASLFHAPQDVDELDQCIRSLALRGLLTSQSNDENLSTSLAAMNSSTSKVQAAEEGWTVPDSWIWARCGWLGEARLGKMLDASRNKGVLTSYLRNINVRWRRFDLRDVLQMRVEGHELSKVTVKCGDVVICEGGEPGRAAIWDGAEEFVIQKALHRYRCGPDLLPDYLLLCLEHDYKSGRLAKYYTGVTIKHLTGRALSEYSIPLPPLREQARVVAVRDGLSKRFAELRNHLSQRDRHAELLAKASIAFLSGTAIDHEDDDPVKIPQTELISMLRLGEVPDVRHQTPLASLLARHNGELSARDLWRRFGGEIDAFYAQLKEEISRGWIQKPAVAEMREKVAEAN